MSLLGAGPEAKCEKCGRYYATEWAQSCPHCAVQFNFALSAVQQASEKLAEAEDKLLRLNWVNHTREQFFEAINALNVRTVRLTDSAGNVWRGRRQTSDIWLFTTGERLEVLCAGNYLPIDVTPITVEAVR